MECPVDTDDIAELWRPLTSTETVRAEALIKYAWSILNDKVTDLETRVDDGKVSTDTVKWTLLNAVLRVLKNPDAHSEGSATIDDYTKRWKLDETVRSGRLYFMDADLSNLRGAPRRGQAFTINTTPA